MSSRNSALATLTAQYTDSENEEENKVYFNDEDSKSLKSNEYSRESSPKQSEGSPGISSQNPKVSLRLVSYENNVGDIGDEEVSDDEARANQVIIPVHRASSEKISENIEKTQDANKLQQENEKNAKHYKIYGFNLPPEPIGRCSQELQDKISTIYDKMQSNVDMNRIIQERKEFRNPSIYEKLIQFCELNELGTNYNSDAYNPLQFGKDSYYEELAKMQKFEMEKMEKQKKEVNKNQLVLDAAKRAEEEAKKRKSKWDQPAKESVSSISAPLTTMMTKEVTGTKGTIISAFGTLSKKPKV